MRAAAPAALPVLTFLSVLMLVWAPVAAWGGPAPHAVVGAISPHHSVTAALIDRLYERTAELTPNPARVVIIGPDHFDRAQSGVAMGAPNWLSGHGRLLLPGDEAGAAALAWAVPRRDDAVQRDHCITEHIRRVRRFFGRTPVLALLVKPGAGDMALLRAGRALEDLLKEDGGVVILSMDLSHYKPRAVSDAEDERSLAALTGFRFNELKGLDIDCRRGARLFLALMQVFECTEASVLGRSNSDDFSRRPSEYTTGHAAVLYLPPAAAPRDP